MSRMQIVAKAILTFIGLGAMTRLCYHLSMLPRLMQGKSAVQAILFLSLFIILLVTVVYLLIIKNNRLAYKMAGPGETLNPENKALWLAASLRLGVIFYGLILLTSSIPTILSIVISPIHIRSVVNEIFTFKRFPTALIFSASQWSTMVYNLLKAILAVYLLYGCPHFIHFQLNILKTKSLRNPNPEGIEK